MLDKVVSVLLIVFMLVMLVATILGSLQSGPPVEYVHIEEHRVECVLRGSALSCNWYDGGRGK